jgi:hypothetical protein
MDGRLTLYNGDTGAQVTSTTLSQIDVSALHAVESRAGMCLFFCISPLFLMMKCRAGGSSMTALGEGCALYRICWVDSTRRSGLGGLNWAPDRAVCLCRPGGEARSLLFAGGSDSSLWLLDGATGRDARDGRPLEAMGGSVLQIESYCHRSAEGQEVGGGGWGYGGVMMMMVVVILRRERKGGIIVMMMIIDGGDVGNNNLMLSNKEKKKRTSNDA